MQVLFLWGETLASFLCTKGFHPALAPHPNAFPITAHPLPEIPAAPSQGKGRIDCIFSLVAELA